MRKIILYILIIAGLFTGCNGNKNTIEETNPTTQDDLDLTKDNNKRPLIDSDNIVTIGDTGIKFSVPLQFTKISREDTLSALEEGNKNSNTEMTDEEKELFLNLTLFYIDVKNGDSIKLSLDNSLGELSLEEFTNIISTPTENMVIEELKTKDIDIEGIPGNIIQYKTFINDEPVFHNYIVFIHKNSSFFALFSSKNEMDINNYEKYFSINAN